jgi:multicomponent Na+:H+ antiporter subunit D
MIGALSISAFPLFSGFTTKALVIESAEEAHLTWVAFLLYVASVGTFLHTGLKLPFFTWFGRPTQDAPPQRRVPPGMYVGMVLAALPCVVLGIYPAPLYNVLPYPVHYNAYTPSHIIHTLELLTFTGLGFWMFVDALRPHHSISLDTDWFYRKAGYPVRRLVLEPAAGVFILSQSMVDRLGRCASSLVSSPQSQYSLDRRLPLGVAISLVLLVAALTALWAAVR